jgi:arsenite methyltransferase
VRSDTTPREPSAATAARAAARTRDGSRTRPRPRPPGTETAPEARPLTLGRTHAGLASPAAEPYPAQVPDGPATPGSVWDRAAPTYGRAEPDHFSHFALRLIQFVPIEAGATVLDLACGTGVLASAVTLAAPQIWRLVAADLSAGMLRRAAAEIAQHGSRCGVAVMNAQRLAFSDGTFDTVLCGSALDTFADPAKALAETHRVLRPGGNLGLWIAPSWWWQNDPRWNWHDDLLNSLGVDTGRAPASLASPTALRQAILAAGFHQVSIRTEQLSLHFPNASRWWQWIWSHGSRQILEQLTTDQLSVYRQSAFQQIGCYGIEGRMEALLATVDRGT